MTAKVRIFYHQGIVTAPLMGGGAAFSAESSQLLDQPYLDSEVLICDTKKAQSTSGDRAGPAARLVRIEVQPGKSIYYEINPPNRSVKASDHSPLLSGAATYPFGGGWTISVLEATAA